MNNLLVHIGYHKTATTWLQRQLFTAENDIFEPVSTSSRGPSTLAANFIFDDEAYLLSPFDFNENKIRQEIENIKCIRNKTNKFSLKIPVLSHERLSGNPHSSGFDAKKICVMLKNIFPNAKILIVIREQKSFILSNYFQYLSIGGTCNLKRYLSTKYDGKRPFFSPAHIIYVPLIKEYCSLFGKNNVLVLPYEIFKMEPILFIDEINKFLKTNIIMEDSEFKRQINTNNNKLIRYYLRYLNVFMESSSVNNYSLLSSKISKKIIRIILKILGRVVPDWIETKFENELKKKINIWVGDRYTESNKELNELMTINITKYGYQ